MSFLNDITLGQFRPGDSLLHRMDPRSKLITGLLVMTALLLSSNVTVLLLFACALIVAMAVAKLPATAVFGNLRPFVWLFLITLFFHAFFSQGEVLLRIPYLGLELTLAGLINGLVYSLRLGLFVLAAAVLTLTTSPIEITDGLEKLLAPAKRLRVPTHELTMMMSLSLRFIPTLLQEADRLQKAQLSRGALFEGNILRRIKSVIPLIIPLFISSFRRADELALAMESRCYAGGEGRTSYTQLRFSRADYLCITFALLFVLLSIWIGRAHA